MAFFRPRHPLLRALFALGSAVFYLASIPWVRRTFGKVVRGRFGKTAGKVVDATAEVVDDKK